MSRKKNPNSLAYVQGGIPGQFGCDFDDVTKARCDAPSEMYWQSSDYNTRLFMMFRAEIMGMALSRFKWLGLPKTCDERYLELTLVMQGIASIAFPEKMRGTFFSTQLAQTGRPNIYDNPTSWRAIGNNGFRFDASWKNGVIVWDNRMRYPLLEKINIWARELTDVVRTKQMNRMHQKIPFIFNVPQEMQDQAANVYKQVCGGEPAIIGTDGLQAMKPDVWQTPVEYIGEELNSEMENIWNEIYQTLGIANQTFKTERMIEDEVKSQKEPSMFVRLDSLQCRREAAKILTERWSEYLDEEVRVVWNYDNASENYNYKHDLKSQKEGVDNGNS